MLVLTRRIGEAIFVGDKIVITVLRTEGNKTRLGIEAPVHVSVDREEVRNRGGVQGTDLLLVEQTREHRRRKMNLKEKPYAFASHRK